MDEHTIHLLEYRRLLEHLAGFCRSEPGAEYCRSLRPDLDPAGISASWRLVDEARSILLQAGPPPLDELGHVDAALSRIGLEGAMLQPLELVLVLKTARTCRLVGTFIRSQADIAPSLFEMADLPVFKDLEEVFERSLSPEGEVLDTASPELARVRREQSGLRGSIHSRLGGLMRRSETQPAIQDEIVTNRAGRYVIPVKASLTRDVPGLVHDFSASGQTAYVEPLELVEDNNRLNYLRRREQREVEKVLARLTAMAGQAADRLGPAAELLTQIDGVFAMAAMSRSQRAVAPILDPGGGIHLRRARHPLLAGRLAEKGEVMVPVDITMTADKRALVVSGVNAGGKTVALKTLGILVLMAQTGLHLPVDEGSRIVFFDRILAAIGDEQDLQSDLSTFSGHVRRLARVMAQADENALVLLDELGTGTDPAEGAALGLAVLDELNRRRAWVITATHYHMLKNWARLTEGAENASVRTDTAGRPMFGLSYGSVGFSGGLAMARELGLEPKLVDRAEAYLDEGQKKTLDLMARLEEERAGLSRSRESCESMEEELAAALARQTLSEKKRVDKFNEELRSLKTRVSRALNQSEAEFRRLKREFKAKDRPIEKIAARFRTTQSDLRKVLPGPAMTVRPLSEVRPGQRALVASFNKVGVVVSVNAAKGKAEVDLGGITVQTSIGDLGLASGVSQPGPKNRSVSLPAFSPPPRELNLLGLTVDEALPAVEKSLDQARVGGVKEFAIIHGIGTGRLRTAVRKFLRGSRVVKKFRPGERRAGGEGVTLVELDE